MSSSGALSLQVALGTHVEVELIDESGAAEPFAFDVVPPAAADMDRNQLSVETPLVKALLAKRAGRQVPYRVGDLAAVRILAVTRSRMAVDPGAAERRRAEVERAVADAERTNAEMFASSYTSKWGGYDPGSIARPGDEEERSSG